MAHPKRSRYVPDLERQLPGATVVWDKINNRWDTGRRSMAAYDPEADWHLVVQDDAILCDDFLAGAQAALGHAPEVPVSFYTGKTRPYAVEVLRAVQQVQRQRASWLAMRGPLWGVAVAMPVALIPGMLDACEDLDVPNYDMRMSEHFDRIGLECWYTIPSLADHRTGPDNPSLVQDRGSSPKRSAHFYIGNANRSALDVDWDTEPLRPRDPSQPWRLAADNRYACNQCHARCDELPEMIDHCYRHHGLGQVDMLAATRGTVKVVCELWGRLPDDVRGQVLVVGKENKDAVPSHVAHTALRRTEAKRRMARMPGRFTITCTGDALKYLLNRTGWSMEGKGN